MLNEHPRLSAARAHFTAIRNLCNTNRVVLVRQFPEYCAGFMDFSKKIGENRMLTRKKQEFICTGIDCNLTQSHESDLRLHIRNTTRWDGTED